MEKISYYIINEVEAKHWWFRVRRELLQAVFNEYLPAGSQRRILDIGCGTGLSSKLLEQFGTVFSVDPSLDALRFCRENGLKNVFEGVADKLPFPDNYFDAAIALDVLEHIEDAGKAVAEIRRVLKPGGIFVSYVPAFMFLWGHNDVVRMHHRRYTKKTFLPLFKKDWWVQKKLSYFNLILLGPIWLGRKLRELIYTVPPDELEQVGWADRFLYWIFKSELWFLKRWNLPFGVSLLSVMAKK